MSRPDYFPNCMALSSKMEPCLGYAETRTKLDLEEKENARLRKALGIFLGGDDRFQVAVGGNPIAVDRMLAEARSLIIHKEIGTFDPRDAGFTLEERGQCQKCGCKTGGEEALVCGQIWCHPCADSEDEK